MSVTKWAIDASHSEVQFKVKHLLISNVTGKFKVFAGTAETEGDDLSTAKATFTAEIDSVDTNNEQRDGHLKSGDFFDAANNPQITFVSTGLAKDGDDYKLTGDLTLRGVTKSVTLKAEISHTVTDPWGQTRFGVEVNGKINRLDFGVSFGMVSETGAVLLGNDVTLHIAAEFVKQA